MSCSALAAIKDSTAKPNIGVVVFPNSLHGPLTKDGIMKFVAHANGYRGSGYSAKTTSIFTATGTSVDDATRRLLVEATEKLAAMSSSTKMTPW